MRLNLHEDGGIEMKRECLVSIIFCGRVMLFLLVLVIGMQAATFQSKTAMSESETQKHETEEVSKLLAVVRDDNLQKTDPERVVKAIQRLGEVRAEPAIEELIGLLTFRHTFIWENEASGAIEEIQPITPWNRYPATSALAQIGKPALPALAKVIQESEPSSLRSQNAVWAVRGMFRDNMTEGIKYLQNAATKASTPMAAQRLMRAAAKIEKDKREVEKQVEKR